MKIMYSKNELIVKLMNVINNPLFDLCRMKNWAHREAYLLLKEREDAGIFPISTDFLDPEKIELPSDEELGDIDIRI